MLARFTREVVLIRINSRNDSITDGVESGPSAVTYESRKDWIGNLYVHSELLWSMPHVVWCGEREKKGTCGFKCLPPS